MQSEQYSQRALNNLCNCVTEPTQGDDSIFVPLPLSKFRFEANVTLTLPPRNIVHSLTLGEVSNLPPR